MPVPITDLTGKMFGRWTVLSFVERVNRKTLWLCRCECGTERTVATLGLTRTLRPSRSCGCLTREISRTQASGLKHGGKSKGSRVQREYRIWKNMRNRCNNERAQDFARYGGRGIKIAARWDDFAAFIADMGPGPSAVHTLDRIDNDRGYEPGNVRWATQTEQQRNRRNNKLTEESADRIRAMRAAGVTLQSIADEFSVSKKMVMAVVAGKAWA